MLLRKIALDWEFQRTYNVYYLYSLPDRLRMALISYIAMTYEPGLSLFDLKIILFPQVPEEHGEDYGPSLSPSTLNEHITHLDLSTSVGKSIKLRELCHLLFPSESENEESVLESWDAAEAPTIPRPLLPNLTHLSLAASPETSALNSWKQLLNIASHLPTLTHLSLAFWPIPSLTPNSRFSKVVTPQGQTIQAGGTNPYSHTLDNDWSEAILILRKLSEKLYGLEYLDLTGCSSWLKALTATKDGDHVDWVGAWGKITHLVLNTGFAEPSEDSVSRRNEFLATVDKVRRVERKIRASRAGRGRVITVEREHVDTKRDSSMWDSD